MSRSPSGEFRRDYNISMYTQTWDASRYAANAGFVPALGQPVLELLQPRRGERILDLGCGDGVLTEKLAEAGAEVVGVDSSADMVAAALRRGLDARVKDATKLPFDQEFDAVFSNAVLHWIKDDPDAAIASAYRYARRSATDETGFDEAVFPAICPWSFEQMMNDGFWQE